MTDDMRKSSATTPNTEENTMLLRQTELSDTADRGTGKGKNGRSLLHIHAAVPASFSIISN